MSEPYRKKLIEVALPLEAINEACKPETENPFLKNHPRALHVWWARTPLVACRAIVFASIVDDPSSRPDLFPTEAEQEAERQRLFRLIEELVKWESTTNETVLEAAREEIRKATDGNPPPVLDPFCGRGSIPLEAQRLGLEAHASDLNPVAVLITKALIEIPPRFAGRPPVNPEARERLGHGASWQGAQGLAEDVRYYGRWMRERALERIGHLYPKATLPDGREATVIAWLWARTVTCPNPACGARMPLVRSFALSTKKGKEWHVQPVVEGTEVRFEVRQGKDAPEGTVGRRGARCVVCESTVPFDHVRAEGQAGRMDAKLMAIVAEGERGRVYLPPSEEHEAIARSAEPQDVPDTDLPAQALGFRVQGYGMRKHRDLFTPRQLVALTTFSDLVGEARERVLADGGDEAYADAIATYLGFAVSRLADYLSSLATWNSTNGNVSHLFQRQAIPMAWDFAEANPVGTDLAIDVVAAWVASGLYSAPAHNEGRALQLDATAALPGEGPYLVVTDPPYYDNIGYAGSLRLLLRVAPACADRPLP
jgi:putative DNA methylase